MTGCLVAAALVAVGAPTASSAQTLTFSAVEDATVRAARPLATQGQTRGMRADASPQSDALVKFDLTGLQDSSVTGATLRLRVLDGSDQGGTVAGTGTSGWDEDTVTWRNAPAAGAPVGSLGPVTGGRWYQMDITDLVSGDGAVSLRISTTSDNGATYAAKEAGASLAAQIVVTAEAPDTSAPTTPTYLRPVSSGDTSVGLVWDPSTDDREVTGYDVFRDGNLVATRPADRPSLLDQGLDPDTLHQYSVRALDDAGNASPRTADVAVRTRAAPNDPVLVGAGDIAVCTGTGDEETAALVDAIPGTVFTTGDNVYPDGTAQQFADCYEPSWGRHRDRTMPAVGNHEYHTSGASGYFGYFGAAAGDPAKGYYSYDVGSWHIVVLNSNCASVGGCGVGSPQEKWLRSDLDATTQPNVGAFWHHPLRTSGTRGPTLEVGPLWQALYDSGAEFAAVGHDHFYERFSPLDSFGNLDANFGIRSFVVGTGGANLYAPGPAAPHSEAFGRSNGVLKLTLRDDSYDWEFVPTRGTGFAESGSASVRPEPPVDDVAPAVPSDLSATATGDDRVELSWTGAADNVAAVGYQIERNGTVLPALGDVGSYVDRTVRPGRTYSYRIRAADARANWSSWSAPVEVTLPLPPNMLNVAVTDDTEIALGAPGANYGANPRWRVDAQGVSDSLLKMQVTGVGSRPVVSAQLRFTCVDASVSGGRFYATGVGWSEDTVTWATAPAAEGPLLGSLGTVSIGREYAVDLTGHITGDGTYALRVSSPSTNGADYASSEDTAWRAPYLELTLGPP